MTEWTTLNQEIVCCEACPRLRDHCREVAVTRRRAFRDDDYWGRPVPNFGDPAARLLIVGLAPASHGANRTGRMFTGDRSGEWLYRALHKAGFASQPESISANDGLTLNHCAITAVCHWRSPREQALADETANCRDWLEQTVEVLPVRLFLALGQIAWRSVVDLARSRGWYEGKIPKFGHGTVVHLTADRHLLGSYHPSQQNTFTGRLTEAMFDDVFVQARKLLQ